MADEDRRQDYQSAKSRVRISGRCNLTRATWESYFRKAHLRLDHLDVSRAFGALKPGVFFFGAKA